MLLKIGGGNHGVGIHGTHLGPGVVVRYAHADEGRQTIPWVEYSNRNTGRKTTYMVSGTKPDAAGLTYGRWTASIVTIGPHTRTNYPSAPSTRRYTPAPYHLPCHSPGK